MAKKWTNPRSNTCEHHTLDCRTVDYYDRKFQNTNWQRLDTVRDASDFGVWINPEQLKIIILASNSEIVTECCNPDTFKEELVYMRQFFNRV